MPETLVNITARKNSLADQEIAAMTYENFAWPPVQIHRSWTTEKPMHYGDYLTKDWDYHNALTASENQNPFSDISSKIKASINQAISIGSNIFLIPNDLIKLKEEIEYSKYILSLENGWDEGNAVKIPSAIWEEAAIFLVKYALYIYSRHSESVMQSESILSTPEINPVPNGSIDLSWRTKKARMLINVRKEGDEILAYFYGDLYKDRFSTKGSVPTSQVTPFLAQWMKDNLHLI